MMRRESGEDVMRVLPDGFSDDERRGGINDLEHFQSPALRVNEAMTGIRVEAVRADEFKALGFEDGGEGVLHCLLRGPANPVGGGAQIPAGDELNSVFLEPGKRWLGGRFHVGMVLSELGVRETRSQSTGAVSGVKPANDCAN